VTASEGVRSRATEVGAADLVAILSDSPLWSSHGVGWAVCQPVEPILNPACMSICPYCSDTGSLAPRAIGAF
jgi:hypothetical protein